MNPLAFSLASSLLLLGLGVVFALWVERPRLVPSCVYPTGEDDGRHSLHASADLVAEAEVEAVLEEWDAHCPGLRKEAEARRARNCRYLFMMSSDGPSPRYDLMTRLAVASLLRTSPRYGVSIIWNANRLDAALEAWFEERGVELLHLQPRQHDPVRYHYLRLNAWKLEHYERVALLDADLLCLRNPDGLFRDARGDFSAVREYSSGPLVHLRKDWLYRFVEPWVSNRMLRWSSLKSFNAGVSVLRPDPERAEMLFDAWRRHYKGHEREGKICEQLMLNRFIPHVYYLDAIYNFQKASTRHGYFSTLFRSGVRTTPVFVHSKYWAFERPYWRFLLDRMEPA